MESPKYHTTILQVAVHLARENPVFGEHNINIHIEDDAGGPFFVIKQHSEDYLSSQEVRFDFDELDHIFKACCMLREQKALTEEL
jgi:hypothetical protein